MIDTTEPPTSTRHIDSVTRWWRGAAQWDGEGGAQAQRHTLYRQTTTGERTIKNARMANASGSVTESQELAVEGVEHAGFRVRAGVETVSICCRMRDVGGERVGARGVLYL